MLHFGNSIFSTDITTPIGEMVACATDKGICLLEFKERSNLTKQFRGISSYFKKEIIPGNNLHLLQLQEQIDLYFNKKLEKFKLPLDMAGTDFQKSVWNALLEIPFGKTNSYLELTKKLGDPKAIRAVANANAANKIAIIIPCHRVIGSDGSLTGYAGGLWRKKYLIHLEDQSLNKQLRLMDIL
ncbi:MAG: methylated-DNA--[protein]-cysteine S-methyltransferase [Bacteroidetes bacterium]|nr:methylated-DNA--[protein]-cysteine S-methyltransferase [Bacteroidota bacterium]